MASSDGSDRVTRSGPDPASRSERWRRIQRLVDGALDLPPAQRTAHLAQACGGDAALYESAVRLLEACDEAARTGGFLDMPAAPLAGAVVGEVEADEETRLGVRRAAALDALRASLGERYAIERELGRGGMATVYLARDLRHDRPVAIKVVDRDVSPAGAERFLREIRIAARLTHPHVLGVHDSGETGGLLWYVMPYVEGETLRARIAREGALPMSDARRLLRELADALAYAHERGIVHRDLKPENVLLSGGHAVIADFGIAKAVAAATHGGAEDATLTTAGVSLGTPAYMAPEQVVGDRALDDRADLYALGVLAYEVLTGAHPFGARPPRALLAAHLTEAPTPIESRRPDLEPELSTLVMQLLAKEPAVRPAGAGAVLRALDALPSSPGGRGWHRRPLLLAAAAVLFGTVAVGGWLLSRESLPSSARRAVAAEPGNVSTVAVLPFVNTGADPADDYFSDGLTDELAHALARVPGLRLAGRTSTYAFKGTTAPAQEIGRALDVGAFVTGTVQRAGERIRVKAQLVSTTDGKVLRHADSESRSGDLFAVQDELTRTVVAALAPALGDGMRASMADARRGTTDQEAYDLYLQGRWYWMERGADNVARAIAHFQQAIARDPAFARAHAGLALAYNVFPAYVADAADSMLARAAASAQQALSLDSTLADAHLVLAVGHEYRGRLDQAEPLYRRAVALEPWNPSTHHWFGGFLMGRGDMEEGLAELRQAVQLDPLAKSPGSSLARALLDMRRFGEAEAAARRVLAIDSTFPLALGVLGLAQTLGGSPDNGVATGERAMQLYPRAPGHPQLLFAYAAAGRWADAERLRAQLRRDGEGSSSVTSAFAELVFGDPEPLIRLLTTEEGVWRWNTSLGTLGCNPLLDPLWPDERFRTAMRRIGVKECRLRQPWPLPPRPSS